MSAPTYFLDVNVPMYAAGVAHPRKAACVWIMQEIAEARLTVVIDTQILQEVLYRYGALQQFETAAALAQNLLDLVSSVLPVTLIDMRRAIELFERYAPRGVQARDLLHAATMQNHGVTRILSVDAHFDQIEGLRRMDPQTFYELRDRS